MKIEKDNNHYFKADFLNKQCEIDKIFIKKNEEKNLFELGTRISESVYRKVCHRKYKSSVQRFGIFGLEMPIVVPKWASYRDL